MTTLTPAQIIADIKSLDRIEHDWLCEGRLDSVTEDDIKAKRADLLDELRERFTTAQNEFLGDWSAFQGDPDSAFNGRYFVGYGKTEIEAIERLLELIGEDA